MGVSSTLKHIITSSFIRTLIRGSGKLKAWVYITPLLFIFLKLRHGIDMKMRNLYFTFLCRLQKSSKDLGVHESFTKSLRMLRSFDPSVLPRDRIAAISSGKGFTLELSPTAGLGLEYGDVPGGGVHTGIVHIRGYPIMVISSDATLKGGTNYPITVTKSLRAQEIAQENRIPCLYIVDSGGAFLPLQSDIFPDIKHGGRSFRNQAVMSTEGIHQISIVCGHCTAGGAYTPSMTDENIIVNRIGHIYLGGPALVKAATGEIVSGEELGGAKLHSSISGVTDHYASSEEEAFEIIQDIVSSLNIGREYFCDEELMEEDPPLNSNIDAYSDVVHPWNRSHIYGFLSNVLDGSRFQEFKKFFGSGLIVGFGFIHGQLCGIVINDGNLGLASNDCQKGSHFMQICDTRNIPVIFFQNGGSTSSAVVQSSLNDVNTLKDRSKFISAQSTVSVPKITINVTGVSGDENYTLCGPGFGPRFYFSWPNAKISKSDSLSIKFLESEKTSLSKDKDLNSKKRPSISKFSFPFNSAQFAASRLTNDGIILPSETRNVLKEVLFIVWPSSKVEFKENEEASV
ncbi:E6.4.1.4B [Lepeophtheirus salmonis]|uniref:methylcrotonoyl-CoA carboxylase n=1 Tax=Lepeophtheirus salmonis TaxID=72036 RepID=A0A7R8H035_LEPSM|nr:E6.4.1.4B [Lepeophtheirus salmonis]CAF2778092.1 E6.4.1.4B [Lepeophtheirus salmonis]